MVAKRNQENGEKEPPDLKDVIKETCRYLACVIGHSVNTSFASPGDYRGTDVIATVGAAIVAEGIRMLANPEEAIIRIAYHTRACKVNHG